MAKVIAIANQKGGVGKTTTCVNLSSCVAALGKKVLVVDLDPQGNTTSGYGVAKKGQQSNIYTCLINDDDIRQAIVHTKFNADLIASNTQLAGAVVDAQGRVKLVKMNIDHHPEVAGQLGIRSIPAVIAYNRFSAQGDRLIGRYYTFADEFQAILHRKVHTSDE